MTEAVGYFQRAVAAHVLLESSIWDWEILLRCGHVILLDGAVSAGSYLCEDCGQKMPPTYRSWQEWDAHWAVLDEMAEIARDLVESYRGEEVGPCAK